MSQAKWVSDGKTSANVVDYVGRKILVKASGNSVAFYDTSNNKRMVFHVANSEHLRSLAKMCKAAAKRREESYGIERKKKPNAGKRGDEALALLNERFFLQDNVLFQRHIDWIAIVGESESGDALEAANDAWNKRLLWLLDGQTPKRVTTPTAHDKVAAELAETIVTLEASEDVVSKQAVEIADLKEKVMYTEVMRDNAITHTQDIRRERNGKVAELTRSRDKLKTECDELKTRLARIGAAHIENSLESHSKAIVERDELLGLTELLDKWRTACQWSAREMCRHLDGQCKTCPMFCARYGCRASHGHNTGHPAGMPLHEIPLPKIPESAVQTPTGGTNDPSLAETTRTEQPTDDALRIAMTEERDKWRHACRTAELHLCKSHRYKCDNCWLYGGFVLGRLCGVDKDRGLTDVPLDEIPLPNLDYSAIQDPKDTNGVEGDEDGK